MNQFAVAARNVLICALVTLPLAACGGSDGSSSAAATSADTDTQTALVQANVGMIDRSQTDASVNVASVASNTTASAPATAAASPTTAAAMPTNTSSSSTPASGSNSSSASTGTVAKVTMPIKPATTTDGVATLDWTPPTANTDGTSLTNLAGYTVYYGTSPDNLSKSIKVSNAGLSAYTVSGLTSGTWYFAVTSYSADGVESVRTSTVTTQI